MKVLAVLLLAVVAISNAKLSVFSEVAVDDLAYANNIAYNVWNGFARGFYREHV